MSRLDYKEFYRRNLPHWQPMGATLFVTCCLVGALPQSLLADYAREKQHFLTQVVNLAKSERGKLELKLQRRWFAKIEGALHKTEDGPVWLKDERVARMVAENLHFHDGKKYRLDAYSIMSNHAHLVLAPLPIADDQTEAFSTGPSNQKGAQAGSMGYVGLPRIMHSFKSYNPIRPIHCYSEVVSSGCMKATIIRFGMKSDGRE